MVFDQASASAIPIIYGREFAPKLLDKNPIPVAVVFIVLEITCTALRFWARKIGKIAWGVDDYLMILGAMLCLAVIGCGLGE